MLSAKWKNYSYLDHPNRTYPCPLVLKFIARPPSNVAPVNIDSAATGKFSNITSKVVAFLGNYNTNYRVSVDGLLYRMTFGEAGTLMDIFIRIEASGAYVKITSIMYQDIPDAKMNKVSELITRLNENMVLALFTLHYEMRMSVNESHMILYNRELTVDEIEVYMHHAYRAAGRFGSLFQRVIEKDEEPLLVVLDLSDNTETSET